MAELWEAQGAVRGGWLWILTHLGSNPGFLIRQLVTLSLIICDRELRSSALLTRECGFCWKGVKCTE